MVVQKVKEKEKPVPVSTLVDDDTAGKQKEEEREKITLRKLPLLKRECIIISSIGDCLIPSADAVPKL